MIEMLMCGNRDSQTVVFSALNGGGNYIIIAFDAKAVAELWRRTLPGASYGLTKDSNGDVYVVSANRTVRKIELSTGNELWSGPALASSSGVACIYNDSYLYTNESYRTTDRRSISTGGGLVTGSLNYAASRVWGLAQVGNNIYATGAEAVSEYNSGMGYTGNRSTTSAVYYWGCHSANDKLYVGDGDGGVSIFTGVNLQGRSIIHSSFPGTVMKLSSDEEGYVYSVVTNNTESVAKSDEWGNKLWETGLSDATAVAPMNDGTVLASRGNSNGIYCLDSETGSFIRTFYDGYTVFNLVVV